MSRTFEVECRVKVLITVDDESVIERCVDNHDDEGVPQPDERGSGGWRNVYYSLDTEERVLEHLAFNAVLNGESTVVGLDGWADMDTSACEMRVDRQSFEVDHILDGADG